MEPRVRTDKIQLMHTHSSYNITIVVNDSLLSTYPSPPKVGSIILHFCSASNFGRARPDRPPAFLRRSLGLLLWCCRSSFEGDATYSYIIWQFILYVPILYLCVTGERGGYAAFTLIVDHQRQSCRVAYTHRARNHFTGKQCLAFWEYRWKGNNTLSDISCSSKWSDVLQN